MCLVTLWYFLNEGISYKAFLQKTNQTSIVILKQVLLNGCSRNTVLKLLKVNIKGV